MITKERIKELKSAYTLEAEMTSIENRGNRSLHNDFLELVVLCNLALKGLAAEKLEKAVIEIEAQSPCGCCGHWNVAEDALSEYREMIK